MVQLGNGPTRTTPARCRAGEAQAGYSLRIFRGVCYNRDCLDIVAHTSVQTTLHDMCSSWLPPGRAHFIYGAVHFSMCGGNAPPRLARPGGIEPPHTGCTPSSRCSCGRASTSYTNDPDVIVNVRRGKSLAGTGHEARCPPPFAHRASHHYRTSIGIEVKD